MKTTLALAAALVATAGCSQPAGNDETTPDTQPTTIYADALATSSRLPADFERDAARKPGDVLEFFGVETGMDVLDMFSGGGYYTELVSHVVGAEGSVVAHSNEAYLSFVGDEFNTRHEPGRLSNVTVLMAENNELALDEDAFDAILMVLSYHDLYYEAPDRGWASFDVPKLLAELHKGLRPGGLVGIVDHQAEPGSPPTTGNTVHRIDADVVIEEMTAAGFELDDSSDMLQNPDDDYSKNVFDPELRGKTDRFVLRFRKPK